MLLIFLLKVLLNLDEYLAVLLPFEHFEVYFSTNFPCKYAYRRGKELTSKYFESLHSKKHMLSVLWLRNRQSTYRNIYIKQVDNKETKGESLFLTHFMPLVSFYTP